MSFLNLCYTYIKNSISSRPLIYGLLFAMQIISFVCIFFVYGMIYNSYTVFDNASSDMKFFEANYYDSYAETEDDKFAFAINKDNFLKSKDKLLEFLGDDYDDISFWGAVKTDTGYLKFSCSDNTGNEENSIRLLTEKYRQYSVGDIVTIAGKELKIREFKDALSVDVSFYNSEDIFDDGLIYRISLNLKEQPTYEYSVELVKVIEESFGKPLNVEKPQGLELIEEQRNNMQIMVSCVLIVFVVFNCSLFYVYIYSTKKNTLRIMQICGATKSDCIFLYLSETVTHFIFSMFIAVLTFETVVKRFIVKFYPASIGAYTLKSYLLICIATVVISASIMVLCIAPFTKQSIAQQSE